MNSYPPLRVLSIGEKILSRHYQSVYSRHPKVLNFMGEEFVISLCAKSFCPGPFRLVLDIESLDDIVEWELNKDELWINSLYLCKIPDDSYYRPPRIIPLIAKTEILLTGWDQFLFEANPDSIAKLLSFWPPIKQDSFRSSLSDSFAQGIQYFLQANYKEAVHCFKRKGYGLTPAGDDFLVGLLLGLACFVDEEKKELSEIRDLIFYESLAADALQNTFLHQVHEMFVDLDWYDLISALGENDDSYIPLQHQILQHGASSGADQMSGFYLACELWGNTDLGFYKRMKIWN